MKAKVHETSSALSVSGMKVMSWHISGTRLYLTLNDACAHNGKNVLVLHANIPATIAKIAGTVAERGVNIEHLSNKSRGNTACTLLALAVGTTDAEIAEMKKAIEANEDIWRVVVI